LGRHPVAAVSETAGFRVQASSNLGRQQPLQSAAEKTEKVKEDKSGKGDEQHNDDNRRARMNGGRSLLG
jgi:hypothetical protein